MKTSHFDSFWQIYTEGFPFDERRDLDGQKMVMAQEAYHLDFHFSRDGVAEEGQKEPLGFIAWWDLGPAYFVEHLGVAKQGRGQGVGSLLMGDLIEQGRPIVLEVEPPADEVTRRRIRFYQRLGFQLNQHHHIQPPLQEGAKPLQLLLMSYPQLLCPKEFEVIEKRLQTVVYAGLSMQGFA